MSSRRTKRSYWTPNYFNDTSRRSHRRSHLRRQSLLFILLLVLFVGGLGCYLLFRPMGRAQQETYLLISDTSQYPVLMEQMISDLDLRTPQLVKSAAGLVGLSHKLRPGRYRLTPDMNLVQIYQTLVYRGQTPLRLSFSSIRTQEQLIDRLTTPLQMSAEELRLCLQDSALCASLGLDTITIRTLFLPDTHEVYWTISPEDLIQRYKKSYDQYWTTERRSQAKRLGLTPAQVTTLASIVEEESAQPEEYGTIARLYLNRLALHMKLQADPTLKYATGKFDAHRITAPLLTVDSPYNTYRYAGLPPGPIRYPERSTIDHVLTAPMHNYLYMCAHPDFSGRHNFTHSYSEHQRNARAYQRALDSLQIIR